MAVDNPVLEEYRGFKIRKYNRINFRVSQYEMKLFIDLKHDKGYSARQVITKTNVLCPCSSPLEIVKSKYGKSN